jgi:hypothetical protein
MRCISAVAEAGENRSACISMPTARRAVRFIYVPDGDLNRVSTLSGFPDQFHHLGDAMRGPSYVVAAYDETVDPCAPMCPVGTEECCRVISDARVVLT